MCWDRNVKNISYGAHCVPPAMTTMRSDSSSVTLTLLSGPAAPSSWRWQRSVCLSGARDMPCVCYRYVPSFQHKGIEKENWPC
jgi:hypothetical protein